MLRVYFIKFATYSGIHQHNAHWLQCNNWCENWWSKLQLCSNFCAHALNVTDVGIWALILSTILPSFKARTEPISLPMSGYVLSTTEEMKSWKTDIILSSLPQITDLNLYEFCEATHWTVSTNPIIQETNEYSVKSCHLGVITWFSQRCWGSCPRPPTGPLAYHSPPCHWVSQTRRPMRRNRRTYQKAAIKNSKKCQRQERKRERKRAKLHR